MAGDPASVPASVPAYVAALDPPRAAIVAALRETLREAAPGLQERIAWQRPVFAREATDVCYVVAYKHHVNLGFYLGSSLSDPEGRLEGTGKALRHYKVRALLDIPTEQIRTWARQAWELAE